MIYVTPLVDWVAVSHTVLVAIDEVKLLNMEAFSKNAEREDNVKDIT